MLVVFVVILGFDVIGTLTKAQGIKINLKNINNVLRKMRK